MCLVEPYGFTRYGMCCHGGAGLPRSQSSWLTPLPGNVVAGADFLDDTNGVGSECCLPRNIKNSAEVPDVSNAPLLEAVPCLRSQTSKYATTVGDRRLTTL